MIEHLLQTHAGIRFEVAVGRREADEVRCAHWLSPRYSIRDIRPRRGAIVPEVSAERLLEKFEVMAELEAMCGRLAARRIRPAELAQLQDAHRACTVPLNEMDPDSYYRLNEIFHHCIYAASHNGFLAEQASALPRRLRPYRRLQLRVRNRMHSSFAEHAEIVDAIVAGNGDKAAENLRNHVLVQGERFTDLVATLRQFNTGNDR